MYLESLVHRLDRQRFQPQAICFSTSSDTLLRKRLEQHSPSSVRWIRRNAYRFDLSNIVRLAKALGTTPADLVHFNTGGSLGLTWKDVLVAVRLARVKFLVLTCHIACPPLSHYALLRQITRWEIAWGGRIAARIICVSEHSKQDLCRMYRISPDKVTVIYPGRDLTAYVPPSADTIRVWRQQLGLPQEALIVGSAGRLVHQKGYDILLQAIPEILSQVPQAFFVIIGEGTQASVLQAMAESLGVDSRFHLAGYQSDPRPWLGACDIIALPSRFEGLPALLIEGGALGKPAVASKVGGIPEVVKEGETGLLVPPEKPDLLAQALIHLMQDQGERTRMGRQGYAHVAIHFNIATMLDKTMQIYDEVLQGN